MILNTFTMLGLKGRTTKTSVKKQEIYYTSSTTHMAPHLLDHPHQYPLVDQKLHITVSILPNRYMSILHNAYTTTLIKTLLTVLHLTAHVHDIGKVSSKAHYAHCLTRFYAKPEATPIINMC